jgi:hypothetical protein
MIFLIRKMTGESVSAAAWRAARICTATRKMVVRGSVGSLDLTKAPVLNCRFGFAVGRCIARFLTRLFCGTTNGSDGWHDSILRCVWGGPDQTWVSQRITGTESGGSGAGFSHVSQHLFEGYISVYAHGTKKIVCFT